MPACDDEDTHALTGTSCPHPLCPPGESRGDGTTGSHQITQSKTWFGKDGKKTNTGTPLCSHKGRPLPLIAELIKSSLLNCRTVFCWFLNKSRK